MNARDAGAWHFYDLIRPERAMRHNAEALRRDAVEAERPTPPTPHAYAALLNDVLAGREWTAPRKLRTNTCDRISRLESPDLRHST